MAEVITVGFNRDKPAGFKGRAYWAVKAMSLEREIQLNFDVDQEIITLTLKSGVEKATIIALLLKISGLELDELRKEYEANRTCVAIKLQPPIQNDIKQVVKIYLQRLTLSYIWFSEEDIFEESTGFQIWVKNEGVSRVLVELQRGQADFHNKFEVVAEKINLS